MSLSEIVSVLLKINYFNRSSLDNRLCQRFLLGRFSGFHRFLVDFDFGILEVRSFLNVT